MHGAEHIGEGTIPAFLQCFDGDDEIDRAGPVKEVDAVQFALGAGRDGDAIGFDVPIVREEGFQRLDDDWAVLASAWKSTMGRT